MKIMTAPSYDIAIATYVARQDYIIDGTKYILIVERNSDNLWSYWTE